MGEVAAWLFLGLAGCGSYSANGGVGYSNAAGISGGRAGGGSVEAGKTYLVGEKGPEKLVMGPNRGWVVPNGGGGGSLNFAPTTHISIDSRSDRAAVMRDTISVVQEFKRTTARCSSS